MTFENKIIVSVKNYLTEVNCEDKAYFLGWLINLLKNDSLATGVYQTGESIIIDFDAVKIFNPAIKTIISDISNSIQYNVAELVDIESIRDFFDVKTSIISSWTFPQLREDLVKHFLRGIIEAGISTELEFTSDDQPTIDIKFASNMSPEVFELLEMPNVVTSNCTGEKTYSYFGVKALDLLFGMYKDSSIYSSVIKDIYTRIGKHSANCFSNNDMHSLNFTYQKVSTDAIAPQKQRASDSGYDLTAIKIAKQFGDVTLYDTGIKVQPPYGWYFDLVPRSSVIKTGYMLANSVGIIDQTFTGSVMIALRKVDQNAPDLELPIRIAQLIPRQIVNMEPVEGEVNATERGNKGFGSSGK